MGGGHVGGGGPPTVLGIQVGSVVCQSLVGKVETQNWNNRKSGGK